MSLNSRAKVNKSVSLVNFISKAKFRKQNPQT